MKSHSISFSAPIWLYPGESANWHFVTLTKEAAKKVQESQEGKKRRGWGAVKVKAEMEGVSWETSIFPDKQSGSYLLPIKAQVRKKTGKGQGYKVEIRLQWQA